MHHYLDDGSGHSGTSNTFTVNAGPLHHFAIGNISTQTAGAPFNITLTAQDLNGNTVTSFSGTVNLGTTAGTINPITSDAFTGGARTESVTVTQAGASKTVTVDDGSGHTGTSNTFAVSNTYTWNGSSSSNWNTATNWTPSVVPVATNDIDIPAGGVTNEPGLTAGVATLNNLTIGANRTLTLSQDLNISGVLTLSGGNVNVGAGHALVIGTSGSVSRTAGQVFGALRKTISGAGSFSFPVGTANGYAPVDAVTTAGSGDLSVEAMQGVQPLLAGQSSTSLQRYWKLSGTGVTVTLTFNYLAGDVMGTEASYRIQRVNGATAIVWPNSAPDTVNHKATANGVSSFSDWTLATPAGPTAAPASISGRITNSNGQGLGGVTIFLAGERSAGISVCAAGTDACAPRTITDANGQYHFDNVTTESFYTITPALVNYAFNPLNRSFSLLANKTDAVFTAQPIGQSDNPLNTADFFVRQQYLDFLGREPDRAGWLYWTDQITRCANDETCIRGRRLDVSAAFFRSQEFQESGSYIYRLYRVGLDRQVSFAEFKRDHDQVLGGANLDASQAVFADTLVQRPEFVSKYAASGDAGTFVDILLQSVAVDTALDLSGERESLIELYNANATANSAARESRPVGSSNSSTLLNQARSAVLQAIANDVHYQTAALNRAFVLMQYFGYLQRDIDQEGYAFWLNVLNNAGGREANNHRGMVCSFLSSTEYQQRFSSVVTHHNSECQ